MAQKIIAEHPHVTDVKYSLPNKHYVPVDMKYIGLENLKPLSLFFFVPTLFASLSAFCSFTFVSFSFPTCCHLYDVPSSASRPLLPSPTTPQTLLRLPRSWDLVLHSTVLMPSPFITYPLSVDLAAGASPTQGSCCILIPGCD